MDQVQREGQQTVSSFERKKSASTVFTYIKRWKNMKRPFPTVRYGACFVPFPKDSPCWLPPLSLMWSQLAGKNTMFCSLSNSPLVVKKNIRGGLVDVFWSESGGNQKKLQLKSPTHLRNQGLHVIMEMIQCTLSVLNAQSKTVIQFILCWRALNNSEYKHLKEDCWCMVGLEGRTWLTRRGSWTLTP